ncbi:MAG: hypothetical protein AB7H71_10180 [Alphaproteobacteria bacterium]
MKQVRSSRQVPPQIIENWHRHEEALIDHLVRLLTEPSSRYGFHHSAFTATGLPIEEQIRKRWRPDATGLAIF